MAAASKQAIEALAQSGQPFRQMGSSTTPPDDIAFGRAFHPPATPSGSVLSSDHTMSTISGLSEPLSSGLMGSGLEGRPGVFMNMSLKSSTNSGPGANSSLRMSNLSSFGGARRGDGNRASSDLSMDLSGLSAVGNSLRMANGGSLSRSLSFPDIKSIIEGDNWNAILEAGEQPLEAVAGHTINSGSGASSSGRHSLSSGSGGRSGPRNSSIMSIGGLSMDLQSNASSTQWLQAAGLSNPPIPDDHTFMSGMSTNLDALDLASY